MKSKVRNLKNKKRKIFKNQLGITLIALVVTIVVLLILAGITINLLFSNGGIFKTAQDAANAWNEAVINEQEGLENIKEQIQNLVNGQVGGTGDEIGGATDGLKEGKIIATDPEWKNETATITLNKGIGVGNNLTIQYQIGGITEENWITAQEGANSVEITGLKHKDEVYARLTDGNNVGNYASVTILDGLQPQLAQINLNGTSITTTGSIAATVTHTDNESGVDIANCRWVYNTNPSSIGTETSSYPNTFNSNGETITLSASNPETYYLHVLTVDVAGNKIETISQPITVTQLVTGITLNQTNVTLTEGETLQLTATIEPSNANNKTVSWSSNSDTIASVSSIGLITAKTEGTATITVRTNDGSNISATCNVTVNPALPTIEETLKAGDYVKYVDGTGVTRKCVVLYDSNSNYGIQIITMETVEDVTLGEASRNTITSKTMDDYNNVIKILNNATSKYLNTDYAESVRCVGTVPNNPSYDGAGMFTMTESWFSSYNGRFKDTDTNYLSDYNHLSSLNILIIDNYYWLASRIVGDSSSSPNFNVRIVFVNGLNQYNLCVLRSGINVNESNSVTNGLRPVFKLKTGTKVTGGSGTSDDPYTLGT